MNLTFKRGSKSTLNDTEITPNLVFFTTDSNDHNIYMDSEDGKRYKLFGLNDNDIVTSYDDISMNTYFDKESNILLTNDGVATNGNTTNKYAIGTGYYNNVIGENIQDILYKQAPTITSAISYLQANARSKIVQLWTNDSPSTTWGTDLSTSITSSDENFNINLPKSYLGYIILFQAYLDDSNTIYPTSLFNLPQSIVGSEGCYRKYNIEYAYCPSSTYYYNCAVLTLSLNNLVLNIRKQFLPPDEWQGISASQRLPFPAHKYLIPIAVYGWGLQL